MSELQVFKGGSFLIKSPRLPERAKYFTRDVEVEYFIKYFSNVVFSSDGELLDFAYNMDLWINDYMVVVNEAKKNLPRDFIFDLLGRGFMIKQFVRHIKKGTLVSERKLRAEKKRIARFGCVRASCLLASDNNYLSVPKYDFILTNRSNGDFRLMPAQEIVLMKNYFLDVVGVKSTRERFELNLKQERVVRLFPEVLLTIDHRYSRFVKSDDYFIIVKESILAFYKATFNEDSWRVTLKDKNFYSDDFIELVKLYFSRLEELFSKEVAVDADDYEDKLSEYVASLYETDPEVLLEQLKKK